MAAVGEKIEFSGKIRDGLVLDQAVVTEVSEKITKGREKYAEIDIFDNGEFFRAMEDKSCADAVRIRAEKIRGQSEVLVCLGTGGSYLGGKALIEVLYGQEPTGMSGTEVIFAGQNMSGREMSLLIDKLRGVDFSVNLISKSGKTLEPMMAFSRLRRLLVEKYGVKEAAKRVYVTTESDENELTKLANELSYDVLPMTGKVGGRFSVFTEVGLLPLAVAGVDIQKILTEVKSEASGSVDVAVKYAIYRNFLRERGQKIEVLAVFEPSLRYFAEWWKQLFGESEGKTIDCLFPATVVYPSDLHSMGQMMQQGRRDIFETMIYHDMPDMATEYDFQKRGANKIFETNQIVRESAAEAHFDNGEGIDVLTIKVGGKLDVYGAARMMVFFMRACVFSAYILGVNPYDQPGVEAYKAEMRKRLG